ncbi:maleylpyruvate isomerase family mycothiol-dependent enzyme [Streptomyces sp. PAN_FS17]|uniref:maleylpyruvate isomerase family mycothiol-dependent enzyme n=1 Tax=Streptomyces sp. PAN_FS17 TaxID=1855351 RepID=UPI000896488E|nr:maleylpyruvate isomerase family mycothiol-dependent enzyme [Streptomyces sp. PAN_FS17]SEC52019.1 TIGR03083 family protein [Streptomyces sp. PAN_FS17]
MDPQLDAPPTAHSRLGPPIDARPLFVPEHAALMATLRGLTPDDWGREAVPGWSVRDVVAHVLGDCYGRLARHRDGHREGHRDGGREGPAFAPGEDLPAYIHRINQQWVDAHSRVSPAALTDTLELIGGQVARLFAESDPVAPSLGVSWAGADPAPMWLDSARELTEYWTHRQQIRHATGQGTDLDPRVLSVVLDTFLRALPHTLRDIAAPAGTQVRIHVTGSAGGTWTETAGGTWTGTETAGGTWTATETGTETAGGTWTATATDGGDWSMAYPGDGQPAALVRLDTETAWRLCVRGIEPADALTRAEIEGDRQLAEAACRIVSVVH